MDLSIYEHDIITPSSVTILYINESATSAHTRAQGRVPAERRKIIFPSFTVTEHFRYHPGRLYLLHCFLLHEKIKIILDTVVL